MIRANAVVFFSLALVLSHSAQAQGDDATARDVAECRKIADSAARMACYEQIDVPEQSPAPAADGSIPAAPDSAEAAAVESAKAPSDAEQTAEEYEALTDDVGLPQSSDSAKRMRVTITRCEAGANRNFYFYFDNGQVWKYIGGKKLRYKSCNTGAELVEDRFGFTLRMDDDSAENRVKRIR